MTSLREIFLVSTPIGNIDDISKRAVCVLTQADAIIAEDYRNAVKLLNRLSIPVSDKTIYEINEHNERKESTSLVEKLLFTHKTAVLISDSGTPVIADPGWLFTKTARSYGITIRHVPGGNSVIGSLQISGLPADNFYYAGFLPRREDERRQKLREIRYIPSTIIIMETFTVLTIERKPRNAYNALSVSISLVRTDLRKPSECAICRSRKSRMSPAIVAE